MLDGKVILPDLYLGRGRAEREAEAAHLRHHQRPRGNRPHREAEQELHHLEVRRASLDRYLVILVSL